LVASPSCVNCHNDATKKANLTLEHLDLATAGDHPELWEKVVRKRRARHDMKSTA